MSFQKPGPIFTVDLFPALDQKLFSLLKSLSESDWKSQTPAPLWTVKDVAAHLLDGNIRALSMLRDGYFGEQAGNLNSYQDLVNFLNQLNAGWVAAMKKVSPALLIELLEITGRQYCDFLKTLDPFEKSTFSVAWAGEETSYNWFHIAREYTEKWHHQQQIRAAVGGEKELYEQKFYLPYLDTSMRALPYHYRGIAGQQGQVIRFFVNGEGGGDWFLYFDSGAWFLIDRCPSKPVSEVEIGEEIAWRIFTKAIKKEQAAGLVRISGNRQLGEHILQMLAVMA